MPKSESQSLLHLLLAALAVAAVAAILYGPGWHYPFESDDVGYLHHNPAIRSLNWRQVFFTGVIPTRPLTQLSLALNYHFNQLRVEGYHLVNIALQAFHAGLVVLLAGLVYRRLGLHSLVLPALLAGLLAAVHPVMIESVALIGTRDNIQASIFMIGSLLLYLRSQGVSIRRDHPAEPRWKRYLLIAGSIVCGILAVLSKESAVVLPALVVLADYYLVDRPGPGWRFRAGIFALFFLFLVGLEFALLKMVVYPHPMTIGYKVIPLSHYIATQLWVVPTYLWLLAFPLHLSLEPMVSFQTSFLAWRPILGAAILLALAAFALVLARKKSLWAFGLLWFLIAISMTSSILPFVEYMAVRYLYVPALGLCIAWAGQVSQQARPRKSAPAWAAAVMVPICLAALTAGRLHVLRTPAALYRDEIRKEPELSRPYEMLADRLLAEGRVREALPYAYRALAAPGQKFLKHRVRLLLEEAYDSYDPFSGRPYTDENIAAVLREHPRAFLPLAKACRARGDLEAAKRDYEASIASRRKNNPAAYLGLSAVLAETGDLDGAVSWLRLGWEESPDVDPGTRDTLRLRLRALTQRSPLPDLAGQPVLPEEVVAKLTEVWRLLVGTPSEWCPQGDLQAAQTLLDQVTPPAPPSPVPIYLRGVILEKAGSGTAAAAAFREAMGLNPPYPPAFSNLATLLLDQGDTEAAEKILQEAIHRGVLDPFIYFNLGTLQAQAGRFPRALATYQEGLKIHPDHPLLKAGAEAIEGYLEEFY